MVAGCLAVAGCGGGGTPADTGGTDTATALAGLKTADDALAAALEAVTGEDMVTVRQLTAATEALAALKARIGEATDLSDEDKFKYEQRVAFAEGLGLEAKRVAAIGRDLRAGEIKAAMDAVALVTDTSGEDTVTAAEAAVTAAMTAINAADIPEVDRQRLRTELAVHERGLVGAKAIRTKAAMGREQAQLAAVKSAADMVGTDRLETPAKVRAAAKRVVELRAALDAADAVGDADRSEYEERYDRALAAVGKWRRYVGISPATGNGEAPNRRFAGHVEEEDVRNRGKVAIGYAEIVDPIYLTEDDTGKDALHGWKGRVFTHEADGGGAYRAVIYSKLDDPMPRQKFSERYSDKAKLDDLNASGFRLLELIGGEGFASGSGIKQHPLASGANSVMIGGTLDGVAGTYTCTPTQTYVCASRVVDHPEGGGRTSVLLGGTAKSGHVWSQATAVAGVWKFEAEDPETEVGDPTPDTDHPSYGWWTYTSGDGGTIESSAFSAFVSRSFASRTPSVAGHRGTVGVLTSTALQPLKGTATYSGGAAGLYALGTEDSGHFTADAEFSANFSTDRVTGMIDGFRVGDGGDPRNWKVDLMRPSGEARANLTDGGRVFIDTNTPLPTRWTVDGQPGQSSGQWRGHFFEIDGPSGNPKVLTGAFYTEFAGNGRMVGGFGADIE